VLSFTTNEGALVFDSSLQILILVAWFLFIVGVFKMMGSEKREKVPLGLIFWIGLFLLVYWFDNWPPAER
jgi:hypothetical protein